jgi:hypothetical protein
MPADHATARLAEDQHAPTSSEGFDCPAKLSTITLDAAGSRRHSARLKRVAISVECNESRQNDRSSMLGAPSPMISRLAATASSLAPSAQRRHGMGSCTFVVETTMSRTLADPRRRAGLNAKLGQLAEPEQPADCDPLREVLRVSIRGSTRAAFMVLVQCQLLASQILLRAVVPIRGAGSR